MRKTRFDKLALLSGVALATLVDTAAYAQETNSNSFAIEEIVVTARKKEENLQRTPVAVSAFSANELNLRGAADITDIGNASPNVQIIAGGSAGPSGATNAPSVFIRGIGLSDFTINTDPAVGIYIDNVYLGRSVGSVMELLDLERVEVLRGPQGTLFGANNIGGALSLITAKPTMDDTFGSMTVGLGDQGYLEANGKANIALGDTAAMRVSGFYRKRDGFVTAAQYNDLKLGNDNVWGVRAALRLKPSTDLTIDLTGDYSKSSENPAPTVLVNVGLAEGADVPEISRLVNAFNNNNGSPECATANYTQPIPAAANASRNCMGTSWVTNPRDRINNSAWTDEYGNAINPKNKFEVYGTAATIEYVSEIGTFKSITSLRGINSTFYNDLDHTPFPLFQNNNSPYDQHQFSQELQYNNSLFQDRLELTLGAFYFKESGFENVDGVFGGGPFGPPVTPGTGVPNILDTGGGVHWQRNSRSIDNHQVALFGQATLHITEALHLTGGLRWTDGKKKYENTLDRTESPTGAPTLGPVSAEMDTGKVSPLITLGWDASETLYAYATYTEGYRDGGWSARFTNGLPEPLPSYEPEYVKSYEIGFKADPTDNIRINGAVFKTDYTNYQTGGAGDFGNQTTTGTTINLAKTVLKGAELDVMAVVTPNLRLDWSLGLLDADIADIGTADGTIVSRGFTIDKTYALPLTPKVTSNLGATWSLPLPDDNELTTRVDWRYVSSQYYLLENNPSSYQGAHGEVNLSISYQKSNQPWKLTVGARNLFNAYYVTGAYISTTAAVETVSVNRPRSIFAKFTYNFGE